MSRWKLGQDVTMTKGIGTYNYMAPEARDNKPVKIKSDMYSLGVMLYNMLTKELPILEDNREAKIIENDLREYSAKIKDICVRLLKKNANDRPNTQ